MPELRYITTEQGVIDLWSRAVETSDGPQPLSELECALVSYLFRATGPVSREDLYRTVWEYSPNVQSRAMDKAIQRLRRKIEVNPRQPSHLLTVHGIGYRWAGPAQPSVATSSRYQDELLSALQRHRTVCAIGPRGVGKSTALHAVFDRAASKFPGGVAWVHAGQKLHDSLAPFLGPTAVEPILLLIDDLDGAEDLLTPLLTLISNRPNIHVLASATESPSPLFAVVWIDPLTHDEATQMAGKLRPDLDPMAIDTLVGQSGHNPARIRQLCHQATPPPGFGLVPQASRRDKATLLDAESGTLANIAACFGSVPAGAIDADLTADLLGARLMVADPQQTALFVRVPRSVRRRLPQVNRVAWARWVAQHCRTLRFAWTDLDRAQAALPEDAIDERIDLRIAKTYWYGMEGYDPSSDTSKQDLLQHAGSRKVELATQVTGTELIGSLGEQAIPWLETRLQTPLTPFAHSQLHRLRAELHLLDNGLEAALASMERATAAAAELSTYPRVRQKVLHAVVARWAQPQRAYDLLSQALSEARRAWAWDLYAQAACAMGVWQGDHGDPELALQYLGVGRPIVIRGGNATLGMALTLAEWEVRRTVEPLNGPFPITPWLDHCRAMGQGGPMAVALAMAGADAMLGGDAPSALAFWEELRRTEARPGSLTLWSCYERAFHQFLAGETPQIPRADHPTFRAAQQFLDAWAASGQAPMEARSGRMVRRWQRYLAVTRTSST